MKKETHSSFNSNDGQSLRGNFARRPSRRSSALIITLITLSLLALVAVALAYIVQVDRTSARYFREDSRAVLYSDQGINHAVALLRTVTASTNSLGSNNYWVVQPGQGYVSAGTVSQSPTTAIPLSSGLGASTDPDLNIASFQAPISYAINSSNAAPMRVQWIYVDQEGTNFTTTPPAAYNASDPIVGRYGFWVDNENSRINLNTAFRAGSSPTNELSPNNVELTNLPGVNTTSATNIHNYAVTTPFNSPDSARLIDPTDTNLITAMNTNKFSTTYYNHDPSPFLTYWGAPKIVLTTQKKYATLPDGTVLPYLDIFTPNFENTDPGYADVDELSGSGHPNLSQAGISAAMTNIDGYLMRTDSPAAPKSNPTASFGSKFFSNGAAPSSAQAAMLAMNIIEYVRCKESNHTFVQPIFGTSTGAGGYDEGTWNGNGYGGSFGNHTRKLDMTEMGVWVPVDALPPPPPVPPNPQSTIWTFPCYFVLEIYWPKNDPSTNPPTPSYDLSKLSFTLQWENLWYDVPPSSGSKTGLSPTGFPLGNTISPGQYRTVCVPFSWLAEGVNPNPANPTGSKPPRPTSGPTAPLSLLAWMYDGTSPMSNFNPLDEAGVEYQGTTMIQYVLDGPSGDTFDPSSTSYNNISSVHTAEPSQSQGAVNWKQGANTFGSPNGVSVVGTMAAFDPHLPEPDTDQSGRITDAGFTLPDPAGTGNNPVGYITSLAELGHVDTGNAGDTGPASMPYRTLHFQPMKNKGTPAFLPDWAILDNFITPAEVMTLSAQTTILPSSTAYTNLVSGRININSQIQPFGGPGASIPITRNAPLQAYLANGTNTLDIPTITSNIYYHIVSPTYGQTYSNASTNVYTMPGEIAEIQGIADTGETSEVNLQNLLGLGTTQSDVFRIYSIGQAIQQTKGNALNVTGEHRDCTIVERYLDPSAPAGVSFHVVYHRNITF